MPDPTFMLDSVSADTFGMRNTDAAWMSGLFEGEGCIGFKAKSAVFLTLQMTDRDVVDRLQQVAGCGSVTARERPGIKESFVWYSSRKADVTRLLWTMLPYLGDRRGLRAIDALQRLENCRDMGAKGSNVCARGHIKEGDNLYRYVNPNGRIFDTCKECRRLQGRLRYQKENLDA